MILFLDSTPLKSNQNKNQPQGYIDLRQDDDTYDSTCHPCDPQEPNSSCPPMPMADDYTLDAKKLLKEIVGLLSSIDPTDGAGLHVAELKSQQDTWTERLPQPSQLAQIESPLNQSLQGVLKLYPGRSEKSKAQLAEVRDKERNLIVYGKRILSGTSGKDCRVAQMLIQ